MVTTRKMEKENNIQGARRAKAAPDFSKLHKQWDEKLQKGKAVKKKPLTEIQPFQLTHIRPPSKSSSSSCSDDDFVTSASAKEALFEKQQFHNVNTYQPKRATIGVIGRSPAVHKSAIPRPSFGVSKRNHNTPSKSLKEFRNDVTTPKINFTPLRSKNVKNSAVKKAQDLQGFSVDFKTDSVALDSILNGEGIERLPTTPAKLSSQFGPTKKPRVNAKQGRIVPFSRPSLPCKNKGRQVQVDEQQKLNRPSLYSTNQRWSIYSSRDSFSSKPPLLEWLKNLADESKAKRLAAKQKGEEENNAKASHFLPSSQPAVTSVATTSRDSFLFRKTLVGYQGDGVQSTNDSQLSTTVLPSKTSVAPISESNETATPDRSLSSIRLHEGSTIKSILKKPIEQQKIYHSKVAFNSSRGLPLPKPTAAKSLKMIDMPLRSANKVDGTKKWTENVETTVLPNDEVIRHKSVKWADENSDNEDDVIPAGQVTPMKSEKSKPKTPASLPTAPSTPTSQRLSPIMTRSRGQAKSPLPTPARCSPTNHAHQIKYVMPAEQPMERNSTMTHILDKTNESLSTTSLVKSQEFSTTDHGHLLLRPIKSEAHNIQGGLKITSAKKSWAEVLEEQLDPYAHKSSSKKDVGTVCDKPAAITKKKKKKRIDRCSILEQIYGKDIYLPNSDQEDDTENDDVISVLSKTTFDNSRPMPQIDEKTMSDLMNFNDDDNDDMELEEPSFFTFSKTIEEKEGHNKNSKPDEPFQSTLLRTPPDIPHIETVESIDLTPTADGNSRILPEAPSRQFTIARTPYKQAMLDILHRTLAEARKRKEQEDVFNCTVATNPDNTITNGESTTNDHNDTSVSRENTDLSAQINRRLEIQPTVENKDTSINLISLSDSMQNKTMTPEKSNTQLEDTTTIVEEALQRLVTSQQSKSLNQQSKALPAFVVPKLNSPSMRVFSRSQPSSIAAVSPANASVVLESNFSKHAIQSTVTFVPPKSSATFNQYIKPATFTINHHQSPRVSSKVSWSSAPVNNTKPQPVFPVSASSFPVPPLFSSLAKDANLSHLNGQRKFSKTTSNSAIGTINQVPVPSHLRNGQTIPVIGQSIASSSGENKPAFPVAPLFNSLSHGMKFSDNTAPPHPTVERTNILQPTKFLSSLQNSNLLQKSSTSSKINETTICNESTFLDDSDVCMVFRPSRFGQNLVESPVILKPSSLPLGTNGGAFRPVKPPIQSSELVASEDVSLNTEVEIYTRIAELYADKLGLVNEQELTRRRDGSFNVVARLLTEGDSRHFVPIED